VTEFVVGRRRCDLRELAGDHGARLSQSREPWHSRRMSSETLEVTAWNHVGIRVVDRERSVAFYQRLGFGLVP
jgi:hypothetical protein